MEDRETLFELVEDWQAGTLDIDELQRRNPRLAHDFLRWQKALLATQWLDSPPDDTADLNEFQRQTVATLGQESLFLGNYLLLDLIGRGGMGEVYRARHRYLERTVALKLLLPTHGSVIDRTRFLRESQALAQLDHQHIVTIFDAFEENDRCAMVTELMAGPNLADLVRKAGPLPLTDLVRWGLQIASAMTHAHTRGIVHRDIKPSNLMLTGDGQVKVLDLGIAKIIAADDVQTTTLTLSDLIIGTPDYLAPEQFFDARNVDQRADIYSLGATLYFLATGEAPYAGGAFGETILKHREAPIPVATNARPALHPQWNTFFAKAMAKMPSERFASMSDLAIALASLPTDEQAPVALPARGWRPNRRTLLIASTAAVASTAAGLLWLSHLRPAPGRVRLIVEPAEAIDQLTIAPHDAASSDISVLARDRAAGEILLAAPLGKVRLQLTHPHYPTAHLRFHVEATQTAEGTAAIQEVSLRHKGPKQWRLVKTVDAESYYLSLIDPAWEGWKIDWLSDQEVQANHIVLLPAEGDGTMYVRVIEKPNAMVQLQMPNAPHPDNRYIAADIDDQLLGQDSIPARLIHSGSNATLWRMHKTDAGEITFESVSASGHFLAPLYAQPHMALDVRGRVMRTSNPVHAKRIQ